MCYTRDLWTTSVYKPSHLVQEVRLGISPAETKLLAHIDLLYDTHKYICKNASEIDKVACVILQGSPAEPSNH